MMFGIIIIYMIELVQCTHNPNFICRLIVADDVNQQGDDGELYQNQLADPNVRNQYDKYWNAVLDSSMESLPDLKWSGEKYLCWKLEKV